MPNIDRKQKMISLRLSEAEYEGLKTHYRNYGVRNISELARLALERIIGESAGAQPSVEDKLLDLERRLVAVERRIEPLWEREAIRA
jgi:hypothetical protein